MRYLGYARRAWRPRPSAPPSKRPEALLIVPCCGDEDGLSANLAALLDQAYRDPARRLLVHPGCFIHASLKASAKAKALDVPRAYLSGLG